MYVTSVSRDTGVKTLVTLEFEIETLIKEDQVLVQLANTNSVIHMLLMFRFKRIC